MTVVRKLATGEGQIGRPVLVRQRFLVGSGRLRQDVGSPLLAEIEQEIALCCGLRAIDLTLRATLVPKGDRLLEDLRLIHCSGDGRWQASRPLAVPLDRRGRRIRLRCAAGNGCTRKNRH